MVTPKHLTIVKGLPYYQGRILKRLLLHPAAESTDYKIRVPFDPTDKAALLPTLIRANEAFTVYIDTLANAILEALSASAFE